MRPETHEDRPRFRNFISEGLLPGPFHCRSVLRNRKKLNFIGNLGPFFKPTDPSHMKKITKFQIVTLVAFAAYLFYEFVLVRNWASGLPESDPIIRADLVLIYPVLALLALVSLYQLFRKGKGGK